MRTCIFRRLLQIAPTILMITLNKSPEVLPNSALKPDGARLAEQ